MSSAQKRGGKVGRTDAVGGVGVVRAVVDDVGDDDAVDAVGLHVSEQLRLRAGRLPRALSRHSRLDRERRQLGGRRAWVKMPVGRTGTPYEPGSLSVRHGKPGSASGR